MRPCPRIFTFLFLLVFTSGVSAAIAGPDTGWDHPVEANTDCQIGNLNDAVGFSGPELFTGNESYAFLVHPPEQCGCTEGGFTVESISQLLYFGPNQVPALLQVQPSLLVANFDGTTGCYSPGPEVCLGPPTTVLIQSPGYQLVTVPMPGCPMQDFSQYYFLSLSYQGGAPAALALDNQPQQCVEYIDQGNGWEDMFFFPSKTGGGKHIVFGDVICGTLAVDNQTGSWGSIKSLYR